MTPPRFSVVVPMYDSDPVLLLAMLDSWRSQWWDDFECVIVDDGSPTGRPWSVARAVAATDPRFRVSVRAANGGIADATNEAIARTRGEWVVFCDHDDLVEPDALGSLVTHLSSHPDTDLIYTDERLIDATGGELSAYGKPDHSPERLLGQNYLNHLVAIRRDLLDRVARAPGRWLDAAFEPCQDHDLVLRASERATAVSHVRAPCYRWRAAGSSVAADPGNKAGVTEALVRGTTAALQRRGEHAVVEPIPGSPTTVRVHRVVPDGVRVVEIGVGPDDTASAVALQVTDTGVLDHPDPRDVLVFTPRAELHRTGHGPADEPSPDPLAPLVAQASRHGLAGARVVTDDGRLVTGGRHARPIVRDVDQGLPAEAPGPWGALLVARECTALAPVGLAVRADVLAEAGGLVGAGLPGDLSLDTAVTTLCARAGRLGHVPVWTPCTTFVVPADHLDTPERHRRRDADVHRVVPHLAIDDPYDPYGAHPAVLP